MLSTMLVVGTMEGRRPNRRQHDDVDGTTFTSQRCDDDHIDSTTMTSVVTKMWSYNNVQYTPFHVNKLYHPTDIRWPT